MTTRKFQEFEKIRRVGGAMLLAISCSLLHSGCWSRGPGEVDVSADSQRSTIPIPVVLENPDEIRVEMQKHDPGSQQFEDARLKLLIKLDEIRQREGVEGFQQSPIEQTRSQMAFVDPQTQQISWRAMTCYNPLCPGRGKGDGPLLFVKRWDNASIGPDGNVVWRLLDSGAEQPPISCPACGDSSFVQPYDQPEVELRRRQLTQELADVRRKRAETRQAGLPMPVDLRPPRDIMIELDELPKLFLVPQ